MKKVTIIILIITLMILNSCSKQKNCTMIEKDGIKIYKNKNIVTEKDLAFNPIKKFTINNDVNDKNYLSYFDLDVIGIDSKQNIYIADMNQNPKVNKYDKEGNFITTFVKKGTGPGEIRRINFLCTKNDTIYIGDWNTGSVSLFSEDGKYLTKIKPKGLLFQVKPVGSNKFVASMFNSVDIKGKRMMRRKSLLLNNSLMPIKIFDQSLMSTGNKADLQEEWLHLTISKDKIYQGVQDKNNYKINIYDFDGNLVEIITKRYASINFTKKEISKINIYLKKMDTSRNLTGKNIDKKHAISGIYIDKNDYLIVQPSVDTKEDNTEGILLDHFKENKYLNTTLFPTKEPYYQCSYGLFLRFFKDKMFLINSESNIIEVYEY